MTVPADADTAAQAAVWTLLERLHHVPANVTTVLILQSGILVVDNGRPDWHRFAPRVEVEPAVPPSDVAAGD